VTPELLADELVPIAAELVGTVRDYGPDDVAAVLARVPQGRHDALAVVLAAMVDPDRTAHELLAWTGGPVQSRDKPPVGVSLPREHGTERGYQQHRHRGDLPACGPCLVAHRSHARAVKAVAS
jgi:hypothetical protein